MTEHSTGVVPPSFLDVVRELGRLSQERCDPECSEWLHRREAAEVIGLLVENPHLLRSITGIADRRMQGEGDE